MDVFNWLYAGLTLEYRLRLWAPASASRAVSVAAELLVFSLVSCNRLIDCEKRRKKCQQPALQLQGLAMEEALGDDDSVQ